MRGKSNHIARKFFIGIASFILIFKREPLDFVFISTLPIRCILFVHEFLKSIFLIETHILFKLKIRAFLSGGEFLLLLQKGRDGIHPLVSLKILP